MDMYQNPVYGRNFPDPFVLKFRGEYWAYATGIQPDGRCFGMLHSRDLVHWRELGGALAPLAAGWSEYWAPEVSYDNGRFLMYYSVGNEEHMEIRVAVADHPGGPFVDSGHRLTNEPFAIDAHVLVDDDGMRYLFYATDFLEHTHIGTGTVVDRLLDPFTLAGEARPVTRARYDWQVYDPQRASKGGVRWHTIEGPFVFKHKGRYYQMFSGGNWQHPSYGMSYAVADTLTAPGEWEQSADGQRVLPILRTTPQVAGPGHNSAVRGPDNRQLYCVYHFWPEDRRGRVMAIDPLEWVGERMLVVGPSVEPRPSPNMPTFADFFDSPNMGAGWSCEGGSWSVVAGEALQSAPAGAARATCAAACSAGVLEVSVRGVDFGGDGSYGVALVRAGAEVGTVAIRPSSKELVIRMQAAGGWKEAVQPLPADFVPQAYHVLRIDINYGELALALDERLIWRGEAPAIDQVALATNNTAAAFAGFALTAGWEDLFEGSAERAARGWELAGSGDFHVADQTLIVDATGEATATKGAALPAYEAVVNVRLVQAASAGAGYGFIPAQGEGEGVRLTLERSGGGWVLQANAAGTRFELPESFDPSVFQQFRFRKQGEQVTVQWEQHVIGTINAPEGPARLSLVVRDASAAFDMVRVTALASM